MPKDEGLNGSRQSFDQTLAIEHCQNGTKTLKRTQYGHH
jgi:hypothetical protein